jgi:lipid-A-disaccharide synthase
VSGGAPRLCILAGEESGDIYGAELARTLRELRPESVLEGMGGPRMEAAGVEMLTDTGVLGGIGIVETHNKLSAFLKTYKSLKAQLASTPYDLVVCIDFPELNLRLARYASKRGLRVVYYVTPQLWAWRAWRARILRKYVERCLVVLPFEEGFYRSRRVEAEYVGHPLADMVKPVSDKAGFLRRVGLEPSRPVVGLLPGSRRTEIFYSLPILRATAERLFEARPDIQFLLPVAPTVSRGQVEHYLEGHTLPLALADGRAHEAISASGLCIITSGTATLEAAILGVPMVIIYRGSNPSYLMVRLLSRLSNFGLPNLVAGKSIVPELIQNGAAPEAVAREALAIMEDPARRQLMVAELGKVRSLLGDGGATERAARRILDLF